MAIDFGTSVMHFHMVLETSSLGWAFGFNRIFGPVFSVFFYFGFYKMRTEVVPDDRRTDPSGTRAIGSVSRV